MIKSESNSTPPEKIKDSDELEVYKLVRTYIEHEDGLVNHRMTWFINLNAFLFLALGPIFAAIVALLKRDCFEFTVPKCFDPLLFTYENHIYFFLLMYGFVGTVTSIFTYLSINAAYSAIDALEDFWRLSYEKTIYGRSTKKPHRLKEEDKVKYENVRDLWKLNFPFLGSPTKNRPYDPAVFLPYITGGGPERQSKAKGKWIPRFLIGCIGLFWIFLSLVCLSSLLGVAKLF